MALPSVSGEVNQKHVYACTAQKRKFPLSFPFCNTARWSKTVKQARKKQKTQEDGVSSAKSENLWLNAALATSLYVLVIVVAQRRAVGGCIMRLKRSKVAFN